MAKKKGLGASFRQQVEKVPVVQQKAPRTISTNVSTNTSNRGGGLGASFKTATQKAEEERSARMRQGISSVVRASFKRQMSQPTTVQKSALKPLATNALAPVKNASTGFKMNVRRNLAPMKEIANYTRGQQQRYAPTPSMDVLPAQDRKTRINVDYGNRLRAGMPSTNTALMSWRSDPTQREREYRDKYGYTQKVKEGLDRRLNDNLMEAYYSPTTGEIRESENGRAFSAGHTDAWARENVEDTIRRQFGIEPDEETLAKIEAQRGTVNYGAGTMLGQGEQYLLTRGLLGAAGLVGKSAEAISDTNKVVRVLENRGIKTGTAKAITALMEEMGIDQAASVPLNLVDAMKADGGANVIKRFGINQGLDVLFSGLFEIPSLRRNINFLNGNELNEAANAMQEGTEKIYTKIGAKRHLDTAVNETGDVARREAEQISMFNDNGEIAVGRMPEQPRVEQPVVETPRAEVPQEPVATPAAKATTVEEPKVEVPQEKVETPKAEPSSAWDEIENEIDNIPTKEPPNKLEGTKSAEKVPSGVERLDSETQEAIEKSKLMTQKEKEASKEAGNYPGGMPKEMEGQPLNKGFDSITRKDADTSDAAVLDIMESVTMGGDGRKVSRGVKEMQEEAAARWENDTATSLKKITVATEGLKDGTIPKGYDTFQEYFADVKEGVKYYQKLQKEAGEGTDAYWKAVENEADIARGAAKVTSNMGAGFRQYQEILGASPKARVILVQKEIKKIEKQFEKLLKGKEIKPLSPEVTKMLEEAQTPVQQAEALEQASIEIWSQIPASLKEKADQWRMTSMLLNPKTHIRNIFGNFLFRPAILIKDAFSTPGEKALIKAGKIDPEDATKAFVSRLNAKDRTYRDAAKKVWNEYQTIIRRSGGKYFDTVDSKGFLTSRPFEVGRFTAGKEDPNAVQRALDFLAKKNGDALEAEDAYFMRGKFVDSYAKILKARKLDPAKMTEEQLQSAIYDAAQEALRSTYRDASGLANAINKARNYKPDASAGKKLVGWAVDATLPFVKTPVNILRRAKDYSPIGFIEGAANLTKALSKGDSKAAVEALDRVASGLTGGGICALGLFLGQMGLLDSKLEDGSEGFYKQDLGYQNYSLKLGGDDGVSISLSWAAPLSIPLFTGVEYAKMRENDLSPKDWVKFVDVAGRIFDPTMEMSVMQGPMALLEAISDGENGGDKILKGGLSVGLNYVGQYYPTISGQVARTVDPVRRNTSSTAESPTGRALEKWKNKQIAKTPFLSQTLEPYVNVWGEEQKTTDNALLRAAYEFGSPAYVNKIKADEVDKEIIRLNKAAASDDDKIIPSKYFSNAIAFDGGKVSLEAKDLTMYNKIKGKASKEAIRKLIKTDEYKNANNDGKRELINNVMKNASTEAKQKTLISKGKDKWNVYTEGFTGGWEEQADAAKGAGIKAEQYYKFKTDKSVDLDENGGKSQYEVYTYLEGTDLTKSQKSAMWNAYNKGWKNNPYAGGDIPEAPDPDDVKLKKAKKEAEILSKAKERQEGSLAAKAFKSSVMKRATETADLLEDSGNSKSGSSKRSRSRRRSGGGGGSSKARAKTESEKRFASLQKMQAPTTGKGIEALSKSAKGLTKAQKKALIKLMQKKLNV